MPKKNVTHRKSNSKTSNSSSNSFKNTKSNRSNKPNVSQGASASKDISRLGRKIVGIHACKEAINVRPGAIHSVYLKNGFEQNQDLMFFKNWSEQNHVKCFTEKDSFFKKYAQVHQGICLVVTEKPEFDFKVISKKQNSLILVLDGIEDPHNLGAILRTSWLMGVDAILVPENRAASLTATAMKVACGGAEHVPVIEETNLAATIKSMKESGYWIYGLSHEAKDTFWWLVLKIKACDCQLKESAISWFLCLKPRPMLHIMHQWLVLWLFRNILGNFLNKF
jgi:23S rRNA (guanosine2251-2'-O)-methyltransferase